MSDKNLEELSALMDGETSELEVRRVLKSVAEDERLAQKWARYQLTSSVLRGETHGRAMEWRELDLSARVAQALEAEAPHEAQVQRKRLSAALVKPFANVAVAASVSAAVILGWQGLQGQAVQSGGPVPVVAATAGGVGPAVLPAGGLVPVSQGSVTRVPASIPRQDIIRYNPAVDDQLNEYLISHSSNAAVNTATGVAPYARVVGLKPVRAGQQSEQ